METLSILFVLALLLSLFIQLWLSNRQTKAVSKNRPSVPDAFAEQISIEQHQKAADYTIAKLTINKIELVLWTLAISQFLIAFLRLFERGYQTHQAKDQLLDPMRK